jgi:exosortase/archaeosortase family protein
MGRRELLLWTGVYLLANNLVGALMAVQAGGIGWTGGLHGSRFGGFDAIAWGVALWRLSKTPARAASWREIALAVVLCLIGGLVRQEAAMLALTGFALWLFASDEAEGRGAAVVLLAITSHQLWGRIVFSAISAEVVRGDAAMVGQVLSWATKGVSWRANIITMPNGFSIEVLEGCSSFTNVSAALLAWVAFAKLERLAWTPRDLWVGAAAAVVQVVLNVARLCLVAQSLAMFDYWHDGQGAQIYAAVASAAAVLIAVIGTRWAERR